MNILLLGKTRRMSRHIGANFLSGQTMVVRTPAKCFETYHSCDQGTGSLWGNLKFQNMLLKIKKLFTIFKVSQPHPALQP
jgi:hypothetical protein